VLLSLVCSSDDIRLLHDRSTGEKKKLLIQMEGKGLHVTRCEIKTSNEGFVNSRKKRKCNNTGEKGGLLKKRGKCRRKESKGK